MRPRLKSALTWALRRVRRGPAVPLLSALAMAASTVALVSCTDTNTPSAGQISGGVRQGDSTVAPRLFVNLDIYQIYLPLGAVSKSEEFWKRIHEQVMDTTVYDRLYRNGVRVGQGETADWTYFSDIMNKSPVYVEPSVEQTNNISTTELLMKDNVPEQIVAWFNNKESLEIHTYDDSRNLLRLQFQPLQRKLGDVRISLCPEVVARMKRIVYRPNAVGGGHDEVEWVADQAIYDCKLEIDVPMDRFLVIAPTPDAGDNGGKYSIGANFLTGDGRTSRLEEVVIIVPRLYRYGEATSRPLATTVPSLK